MASNLGCELLEAGRDEKCFLGRTGTLGSNERRNGDSLSPVFARRLDDPWKRL